MKEFKREQYFILKTGNKSLIPVVSLILKGISSFK